MTGWDISLSGVQRVLGDTARAAEEIANTGKAMEKTVVGAAEAAGTIVEGGVEKSGVQGPVAAALGEFFDAYKKDLMYVAVRASDSINGAQAATDEYIKGDLRMAAIAQREALREPKIDLRGASGTKEGR